MTLAQINSFGQLAAIINICHAGGTDAKDDSGCPLFSPELMPEDWAMLEYLIGRKLTDEEESVAIAGYDGVIWATI